MQGNLFGQQGARQQSLLTPRKYIKQLQTVVATLNKYLVSLSAEIGKALKVQFVCELALCSACGQHTCWEYLFFVFAHPLRGHTFICVPISACEGANVCQW